jgi:hypothetical protein
VASFFVAEHTDANKDQIKLAHENLGARLDEVNGRLARIEAVLTGSTQAADVHSDAQQEAQPNTQPGPTPERLPSAPTDPRSDPSPSP